MPATIGVIATYVGGAVAGAAGVGTTAGLIAGVAAYAATYVALTAALAYAANELLGPKKPTLGASGREVTVRSTIEPMKMVYGEALVSGPIVYVNTTSPMNAPAVDTLAELWHVIALAGHECDDWTELRLDDRVIPRSDFGADGDVNNGEFLGIVPALGVYFNNGADVQAAIPEMVSNFNDWTLAHRGRGICHIATRFQTADVFEELWAQGPPRNIQVVLRGKKVYDPRRDPTSPHYDGAGAQSLGNLGTYEWSDNPILCTADYMVDVRLGMGFALGRIDWGHVAGQADICDVVVPTPGGDQKRYTLNGTLNTGTDHRENLRELLTSFNGRITYTGDKFLILAPSFQVPVGGISLTDDDMLSSVQVSTGIRKQDRYNTVTGVFYDPDNEYQPNEYPDVTIPALRLRDNGEVLTSDQRYLMIDNVYQAQRVARQRLLIDDQNVSFVATFNLKALPLIVHDNVFITVDDLGWFNKIFQVKEWTFVDAGDTLGIQMRLVEDDGAVYADPDVGDYSVLGPGGTVSAPANTVPAPTNVTAVPVPGGVEIRWENSTEIAFYSHSVVRCFAPTVTAFNVQVFEGNSTIYTQTYTTPTLATYTVFHVDQFGQESVGVVAPAVTSLPASGGGTPGASIGVWDSPIDKLWQSNDTINYIPAPFTFTETVRLHFAGTVTTVTITATLNTTSGLVSAVSTVAGPEAGNITVSDNGTNNTTRVDLQMTHSSGPSTIGVYGVLQVGDTGPGK